LIAKSAIVNGWTAYVANLGRLVVQIREGYEKKEEGAVTEEGVIRTLSDVDFLVLDDLGAGESDSQKIERRILYLVAEARQSGVKPTIITTNLGKGEVWDYLGARVANRFMPLSSIEVNHGTNFRSPVGRKTLW
jgi:DNA replication protein DnaC